MGTGLFQALGSWIWAKKRGEQPNKGGGTEARNSLVLLNIFSCSPSFLPYNGEPGTG